MSFRILLVPCFALLVSCGDIGELIGADASSHCDLRNATVAGPTPRCQERVNTRKEPAELFKQTCNGIGGKPGDGPCPREGIIGGCFISKQGDGSDINDWYYPPRTVEEGKKACADDNGTWLDK
ncbi:MAG: hypothetical protein ACK4N5_01950 [Myxococcales bacterium]